MSDQDNELVHLTIDVVSAFVGQNNMRPEDVPALIANVHKAVAALQGSVPAGATEGAAEQEEPAIEYPPAVTVRKSLGSREHIISMIDGKPYKTLKRHLGQHGLTPAQYRDRYNLKADYPMVAPAYSDVRKAMALKIGLGQKVVGKRAAANMSGPKPLVQPAAPAPAVAADTPTPAKGSAKPVAAKSASAKTSTKTAAKGAPETSGTARAKRGRRPTAKTPTPAAAE